MLASYSEYSYILDEESHVLCGVISLFRLYGEMVLRNPSSQNSLGNRAPSEIHILVHQLSAEQSNHRVARGRHCIVVKAGDTI